MSQYLKYIPIVVVVAIYLARMAEVSAKRVVIKGPVQEKNTFRFFMISGLIAVFGGITEYCFSGMQYHWVQIAIGILLALSSFALRKAAIEALGQFWSLHIEIRENHQFVRTGPFRWMRHPTYFSMILETLSVILILQSYISGVLAFLIFIPALLARLRKEEIAMVIKFGSEYEAYQKATPVLFPFRLP